MSNREIVRKADMVLTELDGAKLQGKQAQEFFVKAQNGSQIMPFANTVLVPEGTRTIPRITLSGRILHPVNDGQALTASERSKPTIDSVSINLHKFLAEIRLPYEAIYFNMEGRNIQDTIRSLIAEKIGEEMDDLVLNSDTTSVDPYYQQFDGMRATAGVTYDAATSILDKTLLKEILQNLDFKYRKNLKQLAYFVSANSELNYRDNLSSRATTLGDKYIEGNAPVYYNGSRLIATGAMPENLGGTGDLTNAILTNPKNINVALRNSIEFETAKDIQSQVWIIVATIYLDFVYSEAEGAVLTTNIGL